MKKFAVVIQSQERNTHVTSIGTASLDEAQKVLDKHYRKVKESMKNGEVMIIAEVDGEPVFDANNRFVLTSGNLDLFYKFLT